MEKIQYFSLFVLIRRKVELFAQWFFGISRGWKLKSFSFLMRVFIESKKNIISVCKQASKQTFSANFPSQCESFFSCCRNRICNLTRIRIEKKLCFLFWKFKDKLKVEWLFSQVRNEIKWINIRMSLFSLSLLLLKKFSFKKHFTTNAMFTTPFPRLLYFAIWRQKVSSLDVVSLHIEQIAVL